MRYFEQSTTSDLPTVCPACDVPPPRAQNRRALASSNRYRPIGFLNRAWGDHANRHDLVVGGVGGVAAARESVELNLTGQFGFQPTFQTGHHYGHVFYPFGLSQAYAL